MSSEPDKQVARQGWVQTVVTVGAVLVTTAIGYSDTRNTANNARADAATARDDAAKAHDKLHLLERELLKMKEETNVSLKEIKTILEQRLPK